VAGGKTEECVGAADADFLSVRWWNAENFIEQRSAGLIGAQGEGLQFGVALRSITIKGVGLPMRIERRFTADTKSAYGSLQFRQTSSEIRNPDGSLVFSAPDISVPEGFSQVASDILAQKYFRKAGVPVRLKRVEESSVPSFLWRSVADEEALAELPEEERYVGETDARQVFDRLAGTWAYWAWKGGYFDSEDDAQAYFDEMRYMLATQMAAPNSPQWFNTGLH
jgi:ribonucleoside-diphosphate reductase alpha chain